MNTFLLMVLNKKTSLVLQPLLSTKPSDRDFCLFFLYSPQNSKHFSLYLTLIECHTYKKSIIFTDSLSNLQSIRRHTTDHPINLRICVKLHSLITHNYNIFCWVLSHSSIPENCNADAAAKNTKQLHVTHISVPYADLKPLIYYTHSFTMAT